MFEHIIETCNKFNAAVERRTDPTDEDKMTLAYLNLDLAKSLVEDLDSHNAKCIAKIILGYLD